MFENLPSSESKVGEDEIEAEVKPLNQDEDRDSDVLEMFIQMVLSTDSELQEYASLLNNEVEILCKIVVIQLCNQKIPPRS